MGVLRYVHGYFCLRVLMGFRECSYTAWLSRSPMFFIVCVREC